MIYKYKFWLLGLIILLSVDFSAIAQNDSTALLHVSERLMTHFNNHPVEKIYLHLDRSYYEQGDTVWFKAYTVMGEHNQLSALSGVLYCELINEKDSVINRHILKLTAGTAWGDFVLPRSPGLNNYHIRAYTNWMRNFNPEYFYNLAIRVGFQQLPLITQKPIATKPDIQFFPEGGELVNGIRSRVAIKIVGINGLGVDATGIITDNDQNGVATFATQHLGMGVFAITPQTGKTYQAKITCADSSKYTVDLPIAKEDGFTLAINNAEADSLYVKIAASEKLFHAKQNSMFYLVAQSGGKIYYTAAGKLINPVFSAWVPKSRFPSGIVQFTLFSQTGEPVNERIVFIKNDALKVTLTSLSQVYQPEQKVKIEVIAKKARDEAAAGTFSISVINESRVPVDENSESTILNNLLLTSDINGYVEQPNYYFRNVNDQTRSDLDVLMLTQGYRRFVWKEALNSVDTLVRYQPEKSLELMGNIQTQSGKPVSNVKVMFTAPKENFIADTVTDINGNFKFTNIELPDTTKILLRAGKKMENSNLNINVKQPDYPAIVKARRTPTGVTFSPQLTDIMQKKFLDYQRQLANDSLKMSKQLKEVTIKSKKTLKQEKSNLYGTDVQFRVSGSKLVQSGSLLQGLQARLPGVLYNDGKFVSPRPPYAPLPVMINERQVDPSEINNYSPAEIEDVRILESSAYKLIYGVQGTGKIIFITTRQYAGTDTGSISRLGLTTYLFKGYYKARTFYSPGYVYPKTNSGEFDVRNTIYWNPDILTNKEGKASFEYFNNDTKGSYRVVIEGIDDDGNLGRQVYRYEVK